MEKTKQNLLIFYLFSFTFLINLIVYILDPSEFTYLFISLIFFLNACVFFINSRKVDGGYWLRWSKIRQKGKLYFSSIYGALILGFIFTALLIVIWKEPIWWLLLCCIGGGFLWGFIMWTLNEKRYKVLMKNGPH
ncbi:hypothetical protein [Rossellomorea aquimaris]|uniref:hypothetical protein n=1 Tax=Rossellomorea aquimaris TaxID=189382 RepID=UPI0007D05D74|nr:hypothetical protein [Rossellomorea aquimaris]